MHIFNYYSKGLKWSLNNGSFAFGWKIRVTKMLKPSLLLLIGYLIYNFCQEKKNSTINWEKSVTGKRCNTCTLCNSVKGTTTKIMNFI